MVCRISGCTKTIWQGMYQFDSWVMLSVQKDKIKAITQVKPPQTSTDIRRFLGMMIKFMPNLTDTTKPLRDLSTKISGPGDNLKRKHIIRTILNSAPVLALLDPNLNTIVSFDASSFRLGAVLLQIRTDGLRHPMAYISCAMTNTEQRYAQIEKKALALTWLVNDFLITSLAWFFIVKQTHSIVELHLLCSENCLLCFLELLQFYVYIMLLHNQLCYL